MPLAQLGWPPVRHMVHRAPHARLGPPLRLALARPVPILWIARASPVSLTQRVLVNLSPLLRLVLAGPASLLQLGPARPAHVQRLVPAGLASLHQLMRARPARLQRLVSRSCYQLQGQAAPGLLERPPGPTARRALQWARSAGLPASQRPLVLLL